MVGWINIKCSALTFEIKPSSISATIKSKKNLFDAFRDLSIVSLTKLRTICTKMRILMSEHPLVWVVKEKKLFSVQP